MQWPSRRVADNGAPGARRHVKPSGATRQWLVAAAGRCHTGPSTPRPPLQAASRSRPVLALGRSRDPARRALPVQQADFRRYRCPERRGEVRFHAKSIPAGTSRRNADSSSATFARAQAVGRRPPERPSGSNRVCSRAEDDIESRDTLPGALDRASAARVKNVLPSRSRVSLLITARGSRRGEHAHSATPPR